jgi:hypothetical protein
MKCIVCGNEIEGRSKKFCSQKCYYDNWYANNKSDLSKRRKDKYVPSDRVLLTEEEKKEHKKQSMKKYLETHKELVRLRSKMYHEKNKDNEVYKQRKRENTKKYYKQNKNAGN